MAYFEILYYVMDLLNKPVVYKLKQKEAQELVSSGRGVLWDNDKNIAVETPQEWLAVVEEKKELSIEELREEYVAKFNKNLSIRYMNDVEWIKNKLYS